MPKFDLSKIELIPNSIPYVSNKVPEKEKRILWLGRLDHVQKRADLILPLWQRISKILPDWHLDIVGDGPAMEEISTEIRTRKLENITIHGRQKPDSYFRRSPVYLMTSAFEGFPNTLIEALSFGCIPVLFDSFPMVRWIVKDRKNALLVPCYDIDKMAEDVVEAAIGSKANEMMVHALENARRFEIERVGQLWLAFFDEMLKRT